MLSLSEYGLNARLFMYKMISLVKQLFVVKIIASFIQIRKPRLKEVK